MVGGRKAVAFMYVSFFRIISFLRRFYTCVIRIFTFHCLIGKLKAYIVNTELKIRWFRLQSDFFLNCTLENSSEMTHLGSDVCEMQLNGVSEEMNLLLLDFDTDVMEDRPGTGEATCSVSLCPGFRYHSSLNFKKI